MECSRVSELFSEYIDGVLDEHGRRMVEEHLAGCGRCAEELRELRACVGAFRSLEKVGAPADFLDKVNERITLVEQASWLGRLKEKLSFSRRFKVPLEVVGLTTAALLIVFIVHGVKQGRAPDHVSSQRPVAVVEERDGQGGPIPQKEQGPGGTGSSLPAEAPESAAPASEPRAGAVVSGHAPAPPPTPVAEAGPIQLVLRIGPTGGGEPTTAADGDERMERRARPAVVPVSPRIAQTEEEAPATDSPAQEVAPAISSGTAEKRAASSRSPASGPPSGNQAPSTEAPSSAGIVRKSAPVGGELRDSRGSVNESKASLSPGRPEAVEPLPGGKPEESMRAPLAEIRRFVQAAGGSIEVIMHDKETGQPESWLIRISSRSYPAFLDQLHRLGRLRSPAEIRVPPSSTEPLLVQITFELAP